MESPQGLRFTQPSGSQDHATEVGGDDDSDASEEMMRQRWASSYVPKTFNVLLIEDNDADAFLVGEMFEELHASLYGQCSLYLKRVLRLAEGELELSGGNYDVVLLDLSLPDTKGLESLKRLKRSYPDYAVVILSGLADLETASAAVSTGAQDYLVKGNINADLLLRSLLYARERRLREREIENMQRQLETAERLRSLGLLASGVAHDFNNLLHALSGNIELARYMTTGVPDAIPFFERSQKALGLASSLVNQLLAYGGKRAPSTEKIDLNSLIKKMEHLLRSCTKQNVSLQCKLSQTAALIEGDSTQISQIALNLVVNSVDALRDRPGEILLATGVHTLSEKDIQSSFVPASSAPGQYAFIRVSDNGEGMSESTRKCLFEPFFSTKGTGRGLGLSAVWGAVGAHHGVINVESKLHKGTTFTISFPIVEGSMAESSEKGWTPINNSTRDAVILVADDDDMVREVVVELLQMAGYNVIAAENGTEAIKQFEIYGDQLSLVVLDQTMPDIDGLTVFGEIRKVNKEVPVILSSGYSEHSFKIDELGPYVSFLQKPYDLPSLLNEVQRLTTES